MGAAVVAHSDTTPILNAAEHDLNFMPLLIELFAVAALFLADAAWWDVRRDAFLLQGGDKPVGIIPPISSSNPPYRVSATVRGRLYRKSLPGSSARSGCTASWMAHRPSAHPSIAGRTE